MSIYFQGGAEFVFPSDSKKKRSLGEQMFTGVGTSYMCGMFVKTFTLHFPQMLAINSRRSCDEHF